MTARTKYQIGTTILVVAMLMAVFEILGMSGVIPKYVSPREMNSVAIVLLIIAMGMRRRARLEMAAKP